MATEVSFRELQQHPERVRLAARSGHVFITEGGETAYVLLSMDEYRRLTGGKRNILDSLAMPEAGDIEFEPARLRSFMRPVKS